MENSGVNSYAEVTITKPARVLHCSDGIIEEIEEENVEELHSKPSNEENIDPVSAH